MEKKDELDEKGGCCRIGLFFAGLIRSLKVFLIPCIRQQDILRWSVNRF